MIAITHSDGCIRIEGHAGYAAHGQDIVCAAISTLTQVFLASVEELTEDNLISDIRAGNALIEYGNLSANAQLLMSSFFVGIQMIAESYPENVQLVGFSD